MPVIAKTLLKRIAADLAERPLAPGEMRRILKMGPHYISADPEYEGARWMFEIEVVGKPYFIYYINDRSEPMA